MQFVWERLKQKYVPPPAESVEDELVEEEADDKRVKQTMLEKLMKLMAPGE